MIAALEAGWFRREIADASFAYQREVDAQRKLIVGVNTFVEPEEKPLETLIVDERVEKEQVARLRTLRTKRDAATARRCLAEIKRVAATKQNLLPALIDAAEARCTVGEIMAELAEVFGRHAGAGMW